MFGRTSNKSNRCAPTNNGFHKLNECINHADTTQPPHEKVLHFVIYVRIMHNVTPLVLLQQVVVLLRLPPLHRRGMYRPTVRGYFFNSPTTPPPHEKVLHFVIYVRIMHNVTPLVLLQQVVVLLRLPPLHRRGMYRPYSSRILFQQPHPAH